MIAYIWLFGEECSIEVTYDGGDESFVSECLRDGGIWIQDEVVRFVPWHAISSITFENENEDNDLQNQ